jgi:hypothetical protein
MTKINDRHYDCDYCGATVSDSVELTEVSIKDTFRISHACEFCESKVYDTVYFLGLGSVLTRASQKMTTFVVDIPNIKNQE